MYRALQHIEKKTRTAYLCYVMYASQLLKKSADKLTCCRLSCTRDWFMLFCMSQPRAQLGVRWVSQTTF